MERLTNRINEVVCYTQGKYGDTTICAEMENDEVRKCMKKLAEYEDLEEQGLLIKLPCKVGDTAYIVNRIAKTIKESKIEEINVYIADGGVLIELFSEFLDFNNTYLGRMVFLTREEAEKKLAELEGGVSNE